MHPSLIKYSSKWWIARCQISSSSPYLYENYLWAAPSSASTPLFSSTSFLSMCSAPMCTWHLLPSRTRRLSLHILSLSSRLCWGFMRGNYRKGLSVSERRTLSRTSRSSPFMSMFTRLYRWILSDCFGWSRINRLCILFIADKPLDSFARWHAFCFRLSMTCCHDHSNSVFQTKLWSLTWSTTVSIKNIGIALWTFLDRRSS